MKIFRSVIFWMHLAAGLTAGLSIFIMCFTGTTLAFESEIVAWTERDVRRVTPPGTNVPRLALQELQRKVREAKPDLRSSGIAVSADPRAAVAFTLGRDSALYVNPYTGEIREAPTSNRAHDFLQLMEDWHRVLAMGGDNRPTGKAINGACNLAFFVLAVSGLYLWIPRTWSWRGVRAIALFNFKFSGKARDFNWHNVIGLWSAPVLIVLTLTAVPISYRWAGNLIFKIAGEEPPAQQGPSGGSGAAFGAPTVEVPRPPEGTRPLGYDALLAVVQKAAPDAELITFRTGGGAGGRGRAGGQRGPAEDPAQNPPRAEGERRAQDGEDRLATTAVSVTVKQPGSWPRTATTTFSLNPYTGEVLKQEGYGDMSAARQIRSWTRFLHTGQALGWIGQLVAGLACLGGCFLVYTGFALAWRRFFSRQAGDIPDAAVQSQK